LKLNLAIAIALGGFIGVLAAFMLEAWTIRSGVPRMSRVWSVHPC
jgi:uncharacterized protein involved in exopolysaccharide biosynthesis